MPTWSNVLFPLILKVRILSVCKNLSSIFYGVLIFYQVIWSFLFYYNLGTY